MKKYFSIIFITISVIFFLISCGSEDTIETTIESGKTEEMSVDAFDPPKQHDKEKGEVDVSTYKSENFVFYKVEHEKLQEGSHWIRGVYDEYYQSDYHGLFIGQVATLFGSEKTSTNNEDLLSCVVAAENQNGDIIYLEVYYGPSGPAIGGQTGELYDKAAEELEKIIRNTVPTDIELVSIYEDFGITIKMGTKNGVGYYKTVFDEEFLGNMEENPTPSQR